MEDTVSISPGREEVFQQLRKRILKAAQRWLPQADAEDLAQDTIVVLLTSDEYRKAPDTELLYIGIKILSYKLLEWRRRQMRFAPLSGASSPEQRDQEEAGNIDQREPWKKNGASPRNKNCEEENTVRHLLLSSLLSPLSHDCKKLISLRRQGKSNEEIRQELGLPSANAVAARLSYCLKQVLSPDQRGAPNSQQSRTDR